MAKLIAIVRREYLARVRSKWFILSTLFAPLLLFGIAVLPALLVAHQSVGTLEIGLIDESGVLARELKDTDSDRVRWAVVAPDDGDGRTRAKLRDRVLTGELDGYLHVPADVVESGRVAYHGREAAGPLVSETVRNQVAPAIRRVRARQLGLDESALRVLTRGVELVTYRLSEEGGARERAGTWVTAYALGMAIYVVVLAYGAMMLRAAVSEKSSKMSEIILSSVRPWQLMLGKTLGVGAVGLTQVGAWLAMASVLLLAAGTAILNTLNLEIQVGLGTVPLFLGLFVTGYFLYGGMYAAVGAIAKDEGDASQLQLPVTLLAIVPILVLMPVLNAPAATSSMLLSWIPFFAPVIFVARYVAGATAGWEIPIVFVLLILAIFVTGWVGGRIYRIGLLMTGVRPTLPELLRWIRHG